MKYKKAQSILDNVYIASPCSVSWESMQGDERKRGCSGCSRNVYNLSDMTKREAEDFLAQNGVSQCMTFFRRADGTIMTDDCPRALRKIRDRCKLAYKAAVGLISFVVSMPSAFAQTKELGKPAIKTEPIQVINVIPKLTPQNHVPMPAGGLMIRGEAYVPPKHDPDATVPPAPADVGKSVSARLVTKNKTLPDGSKIQEVRVDDAGNVITIDDADKTQSNSFIFREAQKHYRMGVRARSEGKLDLAEYFFERAVNDFDSNSVGDAAFRRLLKKELSAVQSQNAKGKSAE